MSAEAADRVAAVASGRPSTPLQTSWFEFLLDGTLLQRHLQKSNPGQLKPQTLGVLTVHLLLGHWILMTRVKYVSL